MINIQGTEQNEGVYQCYISNSVGFSQSAAYFRVQCEKNRY